MWNIFLNPGVPFAHFLEFSWAVDAIRRRPAERSPRRSRSKHRFRSRFARPLVPAYKRSMVRAVHGLLLLVLVLGAPARGLTETGSLRVGLPTLPASLDPASALEGPTPLIARQVFDTLVRYADGGSEVEPALAVHWSVSRDALVWTFRLREGVRFHDGTPLTSQYVAESLERLIRPGHPRAPAVNAAALRLLRGVPGVVKEIRAPDGRTVQITLVQPYAP